MKLVHIETHKNVKKTKKELLEEQAAWGNDMNKRIIISEYKSVPSKEPTYIVEMSAKEFQLVSFYLELENRKPIINVEIDTEIKKLKELSKRSNPIDEFIKLTIEDYLVMNGIKISKQKFELLCNQQIAQISNVLLNAHEYIWNDIKRRLQNAAHE